MRPNTNFLDSRGTLSQSLEKMQQHKDPRHQRDQGKIFLETDLGYWTITTPLEDAEPGRLLCWSVENPSLLAVA